MSVRAIRVPNIMVFLFPAFASLFLHHLVRKHFAAFEGDAQRVGASRKVFHVDALQARSLAAHQAALQVVEFDGQGYRSGC